MYTKKQLKSGFTIIELIIVVTIIAVLASITMVVYNGVQNKGRDISLLSDLDRMEALQTAYAIKHNVAGKSYYSTNGPDSDLPFTPSNTNVVNVVVNSADYCIRGYNTNDTTHNSLANALVKESTVGVCAIIVPIYAPTGPVIAMTLVSGSAVATITAPTSCVTGTLQYDVRSKINSGAWTDYSAWSVNLSASQPTAQGTTYTYQAQARCYANAELISDVVNGSDYAITSPVDSPPAPVIAVVLNGANIESSISTPSTCTAGSLEYRFSYRTNDGSFGAYNTWAAATSATTPAIEGTKFGYQAQARCYVNVTTASSPSDVSSEVTYIRQITSTPASPTVTTSTPDWYSTNFNWNKTCAAGLSARYQYHYYTNYGYDTGWVATDNLTAGYTTAKINYYYTTDVKTQCYSAYSTGPWSASNYGQYYRPVPGVQVLVVAGGGAGGASSSDASGGGGGGGGVLYHGGKGVYSQGYWVTVGVGGQCNSCNGGASAFQDIVANGGGGGGPTNEGGYNGGSGGGGAGAQDGSTNSRGYTNQGWSGGAQPFGTNGGLGQHRNNGKSGGGGGGAGQCGGSAYDGDCGGKMVGGSGMWSGITGGGVYYAAGGGGGSCCYSGGGGNGGGGGGAQNGTGGGGAGNTGSGGGGGSGGGWGGTGIVIIRYPVGSLWADGGSKYQNGSDYVHIFYYSGGWLTVAG